MFTSIVEQLYYLIIFSYVAHEVKELKVMCINMMLHSFSRYEYVKIINI